MPQIKQQKKRVKTNEKARRINVSQKSALKTSIKKVIACVEAGDKDAAQKAYSECTSKLDKSVTKGIHHKNYAARQKSRLAGLVNSME